MGLQGAVGRSHESWHRTCTHTSFSQRDCLDRRTNIASDIFHVCLDVREQPSPGLPLNPILWLMMSQWPGRQVCLQAIPRKRMKHLRLFSPKLMFIWFFLNQRCKSWLQFIPWGRLEQEPTPGCVWIFTMQQRYTVWMVALTIANSMICILAFSSALHLVISGPGSTFCPISCKCMLGCWYVPWKFV